MKEENNNSICSKAKIVPKSTKLLNNAKKVFKNNFIEEEDDANKKKRNVSLKKENKEAISIKKPEIIKATILKKENKTKIPSLKETIKITLFLLTMKIKLDFLCCCCTKQEKNNYKLISSEFSKRMSINNYFSQ